MMGQKLTIDWSMVIDHQDGQKMSRFRLSESCSGFQIRIWEQEFILNFIWESKCFGFLNSMFRISEKLFGFVMTHRLITMLTGFHKNTIPCQILYHTWHKSCLMSHSVTLPFFLVTFNNKEKTQNNLFIPYFILLKCITTFCMIKKSNNKNCTYLLRFR